jgi:hypothetical protein
MRLHLGLHAATAVLLAVAIAVLTDARQLRASAAGGMDTPRLIADIDAFLAREVAAHFAAIPTLAPPPDRVWGALTTGEFSWGTFMRALAAHADLAHRPAIADRDVAQWIGRMGLIEARAGSQAFSQMYAALALQYFGEDLRANRIWQQLTPGERDEWRALLDVSRFYDPVGRRVINLAENYLGVAARTAAIAFRLGISPDRRALDALLDRAASQFTSGRLYADDAPPIGRFDRYSNEYARYVWEAATLADRTDILAALRPSIAAQMRLWWDLVSIDGYGYPWGRSVGVVSYEDTIEIVAFVGRHQEFRPAPLADLLSLYARAWERLQHDYDAERHLLMVFGFGRGNYRYISREREWQQTTGFLGKLQIAHAALARVVDRESITTYPVKPHLPDVARFEYFRATGDRLAGVWLVRQGEMRFALPITTGTRPGVADYLPSPHGLPGFAAPVEQDLPALVPYLDLADGRTVTTADGADEIRASADARMLRATWRRWARVGGKPGELVDVGLTSDVRWTIDGVVLARNETLTAATPIVIRRWRMLVPSTGSTFRGGGETVLSGREGRLEVAATGPPGTTRRVEATGDTPGGRGARAAIPLHLIFEASDLRIAPGQTLSWKMTLRPSDDLSEEKP